MRSRQLQPYERVDKYYQRKKPKYDTLTANTSLEGIPPTDMTYEEYSSLDIAEPNEDLKARIERTKDAIFERKYGQFIDGEHDGKITAEAKEGPVGLGGELRGSCDFDWEYS